MPTETINSNINPSAEDPAEQRRRDQRAVGAKLLAQSGFSARYEAVDASFERALKRGESLPGKNGDRRTFAYLSRLEELINKHGNEAEKRLWRLSVKDGLLVEPENVTEAYWTSHKQELRDNGYGNIELDANYKKRHVEELRELQVGSLEYWVNYFSSKNCPYPLWFKVYAFDGLTKMGQYNKDKDRYETRNKTTTAAYPGLDAEVLARVFEVVNRYQGVGEKEFFTEDGGRVVELEKLAQSGNFSRIYSAIQRDIAPVLEPPENPEDVHGEWVEYTVNEVDDIARAAIGTGWCIASQAVARRYLLYGNSMGDDDDYGDYDYDDDYDYDEDDDYGGSQQSGDVGKARFLLFRLQDPETGKLTRTACTSVRLGPDGNVAEISGLRAGQALHDSLIDTVEEKVKTLPGGDKFLEAFADKKELIRLDRKMQNGEDMTKEELEFIYEINRRIKSLDTYNAYDPRVKELRAVYGVEYALDKGIDINILVSKMFPLDIIKNLDVLVANGADVDVDGIVSHLEPGEIGSCLNVLISHGANVDDIVSRSYSSVVDENLDTLLSHGANMDGIVFMLHPDDVIKNLDTLLSHGVSIDGIVSRLYPDVIIKNLDTLMSHGANIDGIVSKLYPGDVIKNLDKLRAYGANI